MNTDLKADIESIERYLDSIIDPKGRIDCEAREELANVLLGYMTDCQVLSEAIEAASKHR